MRHAALKVSQRIPGGDMVLLVAGGGWKCLATSLRTSPPRAGEVEALDDMMWW